MVEKGTYRVKSGLAEMLKGGVIMDVTTAEQARIAEDAGAVAVMALERVPADIRAQGGVARMADPSKVREIQKAVSIPVMAKARIGHFVEAQVLQALEVDYIDESEVLTPADPEFHINKWTFTVPFVCGARDLGEACRRIAEGAAMIRTKGEPGTGNVVEAVRHMRRVNQQIRAVLDALGRPQNRCRFVHVAGTNGKGSVCAMIESGLRAAGLRTGLFTSPHLAVSEMEKRMPLMPASFIRSAMSFNSCRHSK